MLSKKYYRKIAEILLCSKNKKDIIDGLIRYFVLDNPMFDVDRFKEACCYKNLKGE